MTRSVMVTGASKGIGRAIAVTLAKAGFEIVVHYGNDEAGARETLNEIDALGGSGRIIRFDIRNREECRDVIESDIDAFGAYYGIVNNAGVTADTAFPAMTEEEWDGVVHTNLDSFYNVIHPCVMPMIRLRSGGRIITMSSVSGLIGNSGQTNYSAAKAGIIGATKALAMELGKRNITVNCVAPGLIDTGMIDERILAKALPDIALNRMGTPEEVANLVSFLMSDAASYITRQVISINGGFR
ncbi:3-ketoacyl-ACP reductase FabG2 [Enterovibrio coralii]|uniref:Beta-ketoacyl-ACP reductase n=1 Tax=Enterovibrio coralii TaxID=294935 RepID=A0A135I403_9GAMM|nr:3-ketoacyl-ACP reductase FabG2 [Enterovibrio coralii]KXF80172.1 beta-ketoacyl-ACP reductase [Enterovibrio coralii]